MIQPVLDKFLFSILDIDALLFDFMSNLLIGTREE